MVARTRLSVTLCVHYCLFFFVLLLGVLWCECDKTHIIVVLTAETFVLSLEPPFS